MKKETYIVFKVHGKKIEQISADVTLDIIDEIKISLAFIHAVPFEEVEAIAEDVMERELSGTCAISNSMVNIEAGQLVFRSKRPSSSWRIVNSMRPAMDTTKEELFLEFLDLIQKKDYNNAIIFN